MLDEQCGQREIWPPSLLAAACLTPDACSKQTQCNGGDPPRLELETLHVLLAQSFPAVFSHKEAELRVFRAQGGLHRPKLPWADCQSPGPECDEA